MAGGGMVYGCGTEIDAMTFSLSGFFRGLFPALVLGVLILAGIYRFFGLGGDKQESDVATLAGEARSALEAVRERRPGDRRPASYDAVLRPLDRLLELAKADLTAPDGDPELVVRSVTEKTRPVIEIATAANEQAQLETGPLKKDFRFNDQKGEAYQYLASALWNRLNAKAQALKRTDLGESLRLNSADMDELMRAIDRGIEAAPDNYTLYYLRGSADRLGGAYAAAARDLERALEINPDSAEALNALGLVWIDLKQFDKAEETLLKAKDKAVEMAKASASSPGEDYTTVLFNLGRFHEGLASFYARENRLASGSAANVSELRRHAEAARKYFDEFLAREAPDTPDARLVRRLRDGLPN